MSFHLQTRQFQLIESRPGAARLERVNKKCHSNFVVLPHTIARGDQTTKDLPSFSRNGDVDALRLLAKTESFNAFRDCIVLVKRSSGSPSRRPRVSKSYK